MLNLLNMNDYVMLKNVDSTTYHSSFVTNFYPNKYVLFERTIAERMLADWPGRFERLEIDPSVIDRIGEDIGSYLGFVSDDPFFGNKTDVDYFEKLEFTELPADPSLEADEIFAIHQIVVMPDDPTLYVVNTEVPKPEPPPVVSQDKKKDEKAKAK